ncbi:MAG: hypothetical protein HOV76_02305 [Hamadaea sp.]|nr:hypothetical protein [Hamadaea sp.]
MTGLWPGIGRFSFGRASAGRRTVIVLSGLWPGIGRFSFGLASAGRRTVIA